MSHSIKQVNLHLILSLLLCVCLMLGNVANADLVSKVTNVGHVGVVYDTETNLTWLQDANILETLGNTDGYTQYLTNYGQIHTSSYKANLWITYLNSIKYGGYSDWRLPVVKPVNGINLKIYPITYNGTSDNGYNITSTQGEISHLFYKLGNKAQYDTSGKQLNTGYGLTQTFPFLNFFPDLPNGDGGIPFLTGTTITGSSGEMIFVFTTYNGMQLPTYNEDGRVLVVRSGDIIGNIACGTNQYLNTAGNACLTNPTCTGSQTLNTAVNPHVCDAPTCGTNQYLNTAGNACLTNPTCTGSQTLNTAVNPHICVAPTCGTNQYLNTADDTCLTNPTCTGSQTLNTAVNPHVCVAPTCGTNQYLNTAGDTCLTNPTCTGSQTLNTAVNPHVCSPTCGTNQYLNATGTTCLTNPNCIGSQTLNTAVNPHVCCNVNPWLACGSLSQVSVTNIENNNANVISNYPLTNYEYGISYNGPEPLPIALTTWNQGVKIYNKIPYFVYSDNPAINMQLGGFVFYSGTIAADDNCGAKAFRHKYWVINASDNVISSASNGCYGQGNDLTIYCRLSTEP